MKKIIPLILSAAVFLFYACKEDDEGLNIYKVTVQLVSPADVTEPFEGVTVKLFSGSTSFEEATDASGQAVFSVPVGIYEATASDTRSTGGIANIYNWAAGNVVVTEQWGTPNYSGGYSGGAAGIVSLVPTTSQSSQIVIKEIFVGGTPKDDGSGPFAFDKYITLYNNSETAANLGNLCLGIIAPFNAQASNTFYGEDGKLYYEAENWIPAAQAYWYFQKNITVEPGEQVVIALNNAVNNTLTYSKSINFDNPAYYCTYDIAQFNNANYYVTPAASIPTSNYLKTQKYATANAWSISVTSPGVFIFDTKGTTPEAFGADASTTHVPASTAYTSKKVPVDWVIDGVEGYLMNNNNNQKRFTSAIDAGYVYHLNNQGYSLYRNVDKEKTEAISGNAGKLVYGYANGTTDIGGTTDPSGIDAEASVKNGARIVYKDSNNSTNDFHLRSKAALRTN